MTNYRKTFDLSQYIRVPFIGEAFFDAREGRYTGAPFFHGKVRREGSFWHDDGYAVQGNGKVSSVTLHAGPCALVLDRPRLETRDGPMIGSFASWAVVGAPLLALAAIVGGLAGGVVGGLFTRFIAEPRGWTVDRSTELEAASDLLPET